MLLYTVIRHELVTAVPKLMATMCRLGNAEHGAHNSASATQMWRRMLNIKTLDPKLTDTEWLKRSQAGNSAEQGQLAESMMAFVKTWSGGLGEEAYMLISLEDFERRAKTRRNLGQSLFHAMAQLPINKTNKRWVQAMLKAAITARREYAQGGYFKDSEILSVAKSLKEDVESAVDVLESAEKYLKENIMHHQLPAIMDKLERAFLVRVARGTRGCRQLHTIQKCERGAAFSRMILADRHASGAQPSRGDILQAI